MGGGVLPTGETPASLARRHRYRSCAAAIRRHLQMLQNPPELEVLADGVS